MSDFVEAGVPVDVWLEKLDVQRGDVVLVRLQHHLDGDAMHALAEQLHGLLPGTKWLVVTHDADVEVVKAEIERLQQ